MKLKDLFFWRNKADVEAAVNEALSKTKKVDDDPIDTSDRKYSTDGWARDGLKTRELVTVDAYPVAAPGTSQLFAMDEKAEKIVKAAMDASGEGEDPVTLTKTNMSQYQVPDSIQGWFMNQGFIGYQACALIAQHWLVDKACTLAGEDAVRNGWHLKADGQDVLSMELKDKINDIDVAMGISKQLTELHRFTNVFGIRILIFVVDSDDPLYYEKPFNIDGVAPGSYRGVSQVDPYWMTPALASADMSNPASPNFYDPEFWIINSVKYHRSHLIVSRTAQPADILKPTYIFGGVPLTQRIYERVYAAERTANEAPLLASNKRTTAIHVDTEKMITNEAGFLKRLAMWVKFRDNHSVKVLGLDETMDQFDTSLSDLDTVIMNQYQLVAAIAKVPATKLLGTSPKGFNATGEFETISYHEELESIQTNMMEPMLNRHYLILLKSEGIDIGVNVVWEPVDSITTMARAEMNAKKVEQDEKLIASGVISPDEARSRIKSDRFSGYNLTEQQAQTEQGLSPENLVAYQEAGAEMAKGAAAMQKAEASAAQAETAAQNPGDLPPGAAGGSAPHKPGDTDPTIPTQHDEVDADPNRGAMLTALGELYQRLDAIADYIRVEGQDIEYKRNEPMKSVNSNINRSVKPSVAGFKDVVPAMTADDLPKMKMGGMNIVIENPRGSIRKGNSVDGPWSTKMPHHYGFIKGTKGADGDEVDCFIGPDMKSQKVYIVNQVDVNSRDFDEHKVMLGFTNAQDAKEAYYAAFEDGWTGYDGIVGMPMEQFKKWLTEWDMNKPAEGTHSGNPKPQEF